MKKMILVACVMFLVGIAFSLNAGETNVTGKWKMTTETPRGERTRDIEFIQDGEKLTVKMTGRQGKEIEAAGTVKGADIQWTVNRETRRGSMTISYKGKIEGDSMKGEVQFGDFGSGTWNAQKAK